MARRALGLKRTLVSRKAFILPIVTFGAISLVYQGAIAIGNAHLIRQADANFIVMAILAQLSGVLCVFMFSRHVLLPHHFKPSFKHYLRIFIGISVSKVVILSDYILWRKWLGGKYDGITKASQFVVLLYTIGAVTLFGLFVFLQIVSLVFFPNSEVQGFAQSLAYIPLLFTLMFAVLFFRHKNRSGLKKIYERISSGLNRFKKTELLVESISPIEILKKNNPSKGQKFAMVALMATAWLLEALVLYFCMLALGISVPVVVAVYGYFFARLFVILPVLPGGLGETEIATGIFFAGYGLDLNQVVTAAIIFRFINYWIMILASLLLYPIVNASSK